MRIFSSTWKRARDFAGAVLDTAFPANCASCGEAVEESSLPHVCERCAKKIHISEDPRCLTCGYPFFGEVESRHQCQHCERLRPRFQRGWSMSLFRGPVRDLVYALKYKEGFWAVEDIVGIAKMSPGLGEFISEATLVPVPLHSRKLRERGYNQSEIIAEALAKLEPTVQAESLLQRIVDTPSRTQFNRSERYRNLRNAFSIRASRAIDADQRYIIIDDVFTTGSTLNACAAALGKGGAKHVDVLTVGHG